MKNKLYFLAVCIFLINTTMDAQYANKTLSNLTTPVAVNQNLLPATSGSKNLGSTTKQWNSLFVKNGIFLNKQLEFIDWGYSNLSVGYSAGLNISMPGREKPISTW